MIQDPFKRGDEPLQLSRRLGRSSILVLPSRAEEQPHFSCYLAARRQLGRGKVDLNGINGRRRRQRFEQPLKLYTVLVEFFIQRPRRNMLDLRSLPSRSLAPGRPVTSSDSDTISLPSGRG